MTRITTLDAETRAHIAAGEVVERPASVVKELVENSLDAGATRVDVAVENAGLDAIRVADDGHGMDEADALLAFERHATSKISGVEDVAGVETLGFRGEALPSIARMARVDLTTKPPGGEATRVRVEDGEKTTAATGRGVGTTVEVRDLFADTPARRKSLASPKREFARISDVVTRYALARPEVRFELDHDGTDVISTPGSGSYTDAVLGTYGRSAAGRSAEFAADGDVGVRGLLVYPSTTRATPDHVVTAVNGRVVADATVRDAVLAGYGSLLPSGRYPIAVVDVSPPPEAVDVNVHPAKESVAFHEGDVVAGAVEDAVFDALSTEDLTRTAALSFDLDDSLRGVEGDSLLADARVIGQFRDLYLLCETDDDLLVVDQHAAHERINYERLRETVGEVESVAVDPPEMLTLAPDDAATLDANRVELESLGFAVEPFGGGTYRVSAVPAPLGRAADPDSLQDALDVLASGRDPEDLRDDLLKDLACHPSLKAGDALSTGDAGRLVERLGSCELPFACPHGRPTVLSLDEKTLARGFERGNVRLG